MPFDGNRRRLFTIPGLAVFVIVTGAHAQTGKPIASRFPGPDQSFEVASVKANRSGTTQWDFDSPPGRVVGTNVLLRDLIRFAYFIYGGDWDVRIAGPDWIKTARFDVRSIVRPSAGLLRSTRNARFAEAAVAPAG